MAKSTYFIRHGLSEGNVNGAHGESGDCRLHGEAVAGIKAARRGQSMLPTFDKYFSSGLNRAKETAELRYPGVSFTVDKRLDDMNFGSRSVLTMEEIKKIIPNAWIADINLKMANTDASFSPGRLNGLMK